MPTRRLVLTLLLSALTVAPLPACAAADVPAAGAAPATLKPYADEAELQAALGRWRTEAEKQQRQRPRMAMAPSMVMQAAPVPAAAAKAESRAAATGTAADAITNVQTAGVDEGGIVKRAGDHLVILRRGRLFTVKVGGDALQPVAMLDAFAPNADPTGAWYDELLISGNTVVVVGYSYVRGGTEIGLFELGEQGALRYQATYHLRSFDYYSSRNYASRLIGRKLVFYSPTVLQPWGPPPQQMMPGVRRWQGPATPAEFQRILPATRIYRSDDDFDPQQPLALHTITSCELGQGEMRCDSSAVLGPPGRVFYVSATAVYVWTSSGPRRRLPLPVPPVTPQSASEPAIGGGPVARAPEPPSLSAVFRIPLDGSAPGGLKTAGVPIDQLSFLEDDRGHLNVLLRDAGYGEGMWGSEQGLAAHLALLRVPLAAFGDGRGAAQREHYRLLPAPAGGVLQNRYVGDWLLWGGGQEAFGLRYVDGTEAQAQALAPGHAVERIEAMGAHALLVGNAGSVLSFTSVRLGRTAALAGRHEQPDARQGETRTHGFFFRPTGAEEGLLGLPILGPGAGRSNGVKSGAQGAAAVLFLRQSALAFRPLGALEARPGQADDRCKASCVDWYGNARPLFLGERVFALMGYELVEGRLEGLRRFERLSERRRISFAPDAAVPNGRYSPFN